jgi:hypothetical protein
METVMKTKTILSALAVLAVSSSVIVSCINATSPEPGTPFARSLSIPEYPSTVDGVTKASHVFDTLFLRINSLPQGDTLQSIVIDWGDSTASNNLPLNYFVFGQDNKVKHWYVRADTLANPFICYTHARAVTVKGVVVGDTTIKCKVMKKWF